MLPVLGATLILVSFPHVSLAVRTNAGDTAPLVSAYREIWLSNPDKAMALLRTALREDPASPERWSDLADATLEAGRDSEAVACSRAAIRAGSGMPHIRMRAANIHFRMGDIASGLEESAEAVRLSEEYREIAFQSWVRLGGGARNVLNTVHANADLARAYFHWLLRTENTVEAAATWRELTARDSVGPAEAFAWTKALVELKQYDEAATIYRKHLNSDNLLRDAGFENPDDTAWDLEAFTDVAATRDAKTFQEGAASLRVAFLGGNPDYHHARQRIPVAAGTYRLRGYLRSEGLGSRQGLGLRLMDEGNPANMATSRTVIGDTPWQDAEATISVGPGARLLEVAVFRKGSWSFDEAMKGTAWVDSLRLTRVGTK